MNRNNPLVSVVIATFNTAQFLRKAVESVLNQTHANTELIIVDDGSTDETPTLLDELRSDPRVRKQRIRNCGAYAARNVGIGMARGTYVAFLDADDEWLPNKLERQLAAFQQSTSIGVVYSAYECINASGQTTFKPQIRARWGRVSEELLIDNFVNFSSAVVRLDVLRASGGFDDRHRMGMDYDLWLRLSTVCDFAYVDECLVRYRVWDGQISKNYRLRFQVAIEVMKAFIAKHRESISTAKEREAWAHTFTSRGNALLWAEGRRLPAWLDYLRALSHLPTYVPAWRYLFRSILTTSPAPLSARLAFRRVKRTP
jgi:glycosyltransferase involved in cell wall biosynthesis